jgi:hypothetical protein
MSQFFSFLRNSVNNKSTESTTKNLSIFSDYDDHPNTEAFVVDPSPLPEQVITAKKNNITSLFNRSYIEAATIGAGSIAALMMISRYKK